MQICKEHIVLIVQAKQKKLGPGCIGGSMLQGLWLVVAPPSKNETE